MAGSLPFYYTDFSNGFNTFDGPFLLDQTVIYARDVLNVQGTTAGAICKRNGNTTFAALGEDTTSLFAAEELELLIAVTASHVFAIALDGTVIALSGLSRITNWDFVTAPVVGGQGPLFGLRGGGIDPPWRSDGTVGGTGDWTNASGGVAVPNGNFCVYHQNQVFIAGAGTVPAGELPRPIRRQGSTGRRLPIRRIGILHR